MLRPGDTAPDFETTDDEGNAFRLSDYRGRKIVLYFYPRDFTPGCTAEACSLRDSYDLFQKSGVLVFGISGGSEESHKKFRQTHQLPFPILMDKDLRIAGLYDASSRLRLLGLGVRRITYLIDEEGRIEAIFGGDEGVDRVRSEEHAQQIVQYWRLQL